MSCEERVQRLDALANAAFQHGAHSAGGNDARDGVEGDQALGAPLVAVDGEGDADAVKQQFCLFTFTRHRLFVRLL